MKNYEIISETADKIFSHQVREYLKDYFTYEMGEDFEKIFEAVQEKTHLCVELGADHQYTGIKPDSINCFDFSCNIDDLTSAVTELSQAIFRDEENYEEFFGLASQIEKTPFSGERYTDGMAKDDILRAIDRCIEVHAEYIAYRYIYPEISDYARLQALKGNWNFKYGFVSK